MNEKGKAGFIEKARRRHGDKYCYDGVEYKNNRSMVTIYCESHDVFLQKASSHTAGSGCPCCAKESSAKKRIKPLPSLIDEFAQVHGNKYLYPEIGYLGVREVMTITCKDHGDFKMLPVVHKRGSGCKQCSVYERASKAASRSAESAVSLPIKKPPIAKLKRIKLPPPIPLIPHDFVTMAKFLKENSWAVNC